MKAAKDEPNSLYTRWEALAGSPVSNLDFRVPNVLKKTHMVQNHTSCDMLPTITSNANTLDRHRKLTFTRSSCCHCGWISKEFRALTKESNE